MRAAARVLRVLGAALGGAGRVAKETAMRRASMLILMAAWACVTPAVSLASGELKNYARLRGQGASQLIGLGLVVGLNGTGDSGEELVMARPLAEALRRMGNPIPGLEELEEGQSVALVMVHCEIPKTGAKTDDRLDVRVSVVHSAASLAGGVLLVAPLTGATPGQAVYAYASGQLAIQDEQIPTVGFVRGGAQVVRDVSTTADIGQSFEVIIDSPWMAGWDVAAEIMGEINQQYLLTTSRIAEPIARVIDERTIRVTVPEAERADPSHFVADVLSTDISAALRNLPARVVCNTRTGVIVVTGNVRVSPAVITHGDLTITTTVPAVAPTPANPQTTRTSWAAVQTGATQTEMSRLEDLLAALDQLDVAAKAKIEILQELHRIGKLHAELIVE